MTLLAIDPGTTRSAYVFFQDGKPVVRGIFDNDAMLAAVRQGRYDALVVEQVESFGMAVGAEVFTTVHWAGRFWEAAAARGVACHHLPRKAVKLHLCGSMRAKDPNIRQALLDKYGGKSAVGTKKAPGPLYGVSKDVWSALGVAVTFAETRAKEAV